MLFIAAGATHIATSRGKLPVFPVGPLDHDLSAVASLPFPVVLGCTESSTDLERTQGFEPIPRNSVSAAGASANRFSHDRSASAETSPARRVAGKG